MNDGDKSAPILPYYPAEDPTAQPLYWCAACQTVYRTRVPKCTVCVLTKVCTDLTRNLQGLFDKLLEAI